MHNQRRDPYGSSWLFLRIYKLDYLMFSWQVEFWLAKSRGTFKTSGKPCGDRKSIIALTLLCAVHLHCAQQTQDEDDRKSIIALCDLCPKIHVFMYSCFRWFSFIFRYFKVFQVSQMFTCSLSDLLLLAVGSLVVFVLREYILKVPILVSSEPQVRVDRPLCCYFFFSFFFYKRYYIMSETGYR